MLDRDTDAMSGRDRSGGAQSDCGAIGFCMRTLLVGVGAASGRGLLTPLRTMVCRGHQRRVSNSSLGHRPGPGVRLGRRPPALHAGRGQRTGTNSTCVQNPMGRGAMHPPARPDVQSRPSGARGPGMVSSAVVLLGLSPASRTGCSGPRQGSGGAARRPGARYTAVGPSWRASVRTRPRLPGRPGPRRPGSDRCGRPPAPS